MCLLLPFAPMVFYFIPATLVFLTALQAFLDDETTPNNHIDSWVLLVITSLLWPITLPAIMNHLGSHVSQAEQEDYTTARKLLSLGEK